MEQRKMRSIWYFVGLLLLVIGLVILFSGIVSLVTGSERPTVLAHIYPELWWGGFILLSGGVFFVIGLKTSGEG